MCLEEGSCVFGIKQPGDVFIYSYNGGRHFFPSQAWIHFYFVHMPPLVHRQIEFITKPLKFEGLEKGLHDDVLVMLGC